MNDDLRNDEQKRILALDGSLRGGAGNTGRALAFAGRTAPPCIDFKQVVLSDYAGTVEALVDELAAADGFLVGTGTYWSSWGSPLQRFLEVMTGLECSDVFLGKPVGVVVTMDSVGGVDVATRLLGTFGKLGCTTPPLPLVVLSRIAALLQGTPSDMDLWQLEDLEVLVANLALAARAERPRWRTWTVERAPMPRGPFPAAGRLELGVPHFLDEPT